MHISYPKKDFEYLIKTSKGNLFLKYKQSNALGTIEFLNKDYNKQVSEIIDFLLKGDFKYYLPRKWYWTTKKYYEKCKGKETEILAEIIANEGDKILQKIIDTLHKKHTSVFEGVSIPNSNRKTLFSVNLMALCKEYNIAGPEVLLRDYTMEQIERMTDGMVVSFNEYTKEGKRTNDIALQDREGNKLDKQNLDNIKKMRERIQKS